MQCPKCNIPGFCKIESKPGLLCERCGLPTDVPISDIYSCSKCRHTEELMYPKGEQKARAGYCNFCNP